ncbi:TAR DNA-binding protein 43-like [Planococcus citri]|uniref:TAR DNA-binding protein 43-like n=1 Tax=Planococcus citri TaxID=170843 RepID=UPI0031FA217C
MQYVRVINVKDSESQPIRFPCEDNGTLTISSLAAHYPGATALKYPLSKGHNRVVRLVNGILYPPENGWGDRTYHVVIPTYNRKRKADDALETSESKTFKEDTDLVVSGLSGETTDEKLRDYFSKFGELQLAQVRIDPISKTSKGFGFIRFADQEAEVRVTLQRHQIDGQWCDVRIPVSKTKKEIEALVALIREPEVLVDVLTIKIRALRNNNRQAFEDSVKERRLRLQAEDNLAIYKARFESFEKAQRILVDEYFGASI